jgi:hypothetical protein
MSWVYCESSLQSRNPDRVRRVCCSGGMHPLAAGGVRACGAKRQPTKFNLMIRVGDARAHAPNRSPRTRGSFPPPWPPLPGGSHVRARRPAPPPPAVGRHSRPATALVNRAPDPTAKLSNRRSTAQYPRFHTTHRGCTEKLEVLAELKLACWRVETWSRLLTAAPFPRLSNAELSSWCRCQDS